MEKTLRELCEAYCNARGAIDWADINNQRSLALRHTASNIFAELRYRGLDATHGEAMESITRTILAALDAERAAVLEEVREWLEEYRSAEKDAADKWDSYEMNRAYGIEDTLEAFTSRFLAGKEGA